VLQYGEVEQSPGVNNLWGEGWSGGGREIGQVIADVINGWDLKRRDRVFEQHQEETQMKTQIFDKCGFEQLFPVISRSSLHDGFGDLFYCEWVICTVRCGGLVPEMLCSSAI
jgi:hypothetical protein